MKLLLDHHYATVIAVRLRERGHDVVLAQERGWDTTGDERLLALCAAERRTLVTNNIRDFSLIVRRWAAENRDHGGIIFTFDARVARRRDASGMLISILDTVVRQNDADNAFVNRVLWLRPSVRES